MQRASRRSQASRRATWPRKFIASRRFWPAVSVAENAMKNDDITTLWQTQGTEGFRMSSEEIRNRIEVMDRKMRRRTIDGYLICAVLIAFFAGWMFVGMNTLQLVGAILTIIGVSYLAWQIRANRFRGVPIDAPNTLEHLRRELARQRDFH